MEDKVTEFIRLTTSGAGETKLTPCAQFPVLFSHVTQHQTRIIADHFVYSQDFAKLQTLEYQNITAGCALTPKLVCLAHGQEGVISLVAWTGTQYNMIQKASIFSGSLVIDELRKDLFSPLPNQIYMQVS